MGSLRCRGASKATDPIRRMRMRKVVIYISSTHLLQEVLIFMSRRASTPPSMFLLQDEICKRQLFTCEEY